MPGGPGGKSVGRVSVRVYPDTSKFAQELRTKLQKINEKVQVGIELDDSGLENKVKAAAKKASGETVTMKVDLDKDHVTREAKNAKTLAEKRAGRILFPASIDLKKSLAKIYADLKVIDASVKAYSISVPVDWVGLGKGVLIAGAVAKALLAVPPILGAIGGAANYAAGAIALIPAIAAGAATGIAVLVTGLHGMKDALTASTPEELDKALKNLAPSAQKAALALREFKEPLHDIRLSVQEALFKGMSKDLSSLKGLLPPIKAGMVGVAGSIGNMTKRWIQMATSQKSINDTWRIMDRVHTAFDNAAPSAANFGAALRNVTVVGAQFLPELGQSVTDVSKKFVDWTNRARETGQLQQMIQNFIDKTKQLGRIVADVVVGFQNVFNTLRGGRDSLDVIEGITQGFRDWSELKSTQDTLKNLSKILNELARVAGDVFVTAWRQLADIVSAATPFLLEFARSLGGALKAALQVVGPMLKGLAKFFSDNKEVLAPLAVAILGVVTAFKLLSTVVGAIQTVVKGFRAIAAAAKLVGTGLSFLTSPIGIISLAVVGLAILIIKNWDTVKSISLAVWGAIKTAIEAVWGAIQAVGQAFVTAWNAIVTAWNAVIGFFTSIPGVLAGAFSTVGSILATPFVAAWNWIVGVWNAVSGWFGQVPGWLGSAFSTVWHVLTQPFVDAWNWVVGVWNAVAGWFSQVPGWIGGALSTVGRTIAQPFIDAWNWVVGIWDKVAGWFGQIPGWVGRAVSNVGNAIAQPFRTAWSWVTDIWDDVTGFFGQIAGWISSAVSKVWDVLTWPFRKAWDIIKGIIDQIKGAISAVGDAVKSVGDFLGGLFSDRIEVAGMDFTVPVTFSDVPDLPSIGYEPYSGESLSQSVSSIDNVASSTSKASRSLRGSLPDFAARWTSKGEEIADRVAEALTGWTVQIDRNGLARMVNKTNTANARRR